MTSAAAREILNAPELLPHRRCYTLISLPVGGAQGGAAYFEGGRCHPSRHAPDSKGSASSFYFFYFFGSASSGHSCNFINHVHPSKQDRGKFASEGCKKEWNGMEYIAAMFFPVLDWLIRVRY